MEILKTIILFVQENIAYILIGAAILYFVFFIIGIRDSKKNGGGFRFRIDYLIAFIFILGFAIYCLVTGQNIKTFIN